MANCINGPENDRRRQVMVGELPSGFLRLADDTVQQQVALDGQTAAMLQDGGFNFMPPNMARLSLTITQAKLNKNYGLMRMSCYCRIRIGHSVLETPTSNSGGKNPHWNKVVHCYVEPGVDSIYLEIFDERSFTMDDRIGWAHIPIPERVLTGETVDDWYTLNGKQGDGKEGIINLVMAYSTQPVACVQRPTVCPGGGQMIMMPVGMPPYYPPQGGLSITVAPPPVAQQQPQPPYPGPAQQQQRPPPVTDDDVRQVKDMFPEVDDEVIRSVLESHPGRKDSAINDLLTISAGDDS